MKRIKLITFTTLLTVILSLALAACAVNRKVTEITLNTDNVKTAFAVGEEFTYEGLVVTATYEDGDTEEVTGYTVSEPDMSTEGEKTVTVTYDEKSATYKITVTADGQGDPDDGNPDDGDPDDETPKVRTFLGISLDVSNVKRNFAVGEEFTYEGLVVTANYNLEPLTEAVEDYTVNVDELDLSVAGQRTVIITCKVEGKICTASYEITVK